MITLATVGTSNITEKFLSAAESSKRFLFGYAYSRDISRAELFAKKHNFLKYTDSLETIALDETVNAVYIASPNYCHYSQSKYFLEHGKNVLCEKSIVTNVSQYNELFELAQKNRLIYMEAIMSRYTMGRKILLDALQKIGQIKMARLDYCQRSSKYDRYLAGEHVNIFDMSLGAGTLMDLGVYCVYAANDLFGMPIDISASSAFGIGDVDLSGAAIFSYKDFTAVLTYSKAGRSVINSEIIGDKGAVKIGSVSQYAGITIVHDEGEKVLLDYPDRTSVMLGEVNAFADYIENYFNFFHEYKNVSELTKNVHTCMDTIKTKQKEIIC